jgi:hypothetical protein
MVKKHQPSTEAQHRWSGAVDSIVGVQGVKGDAQLRLEFQAQPAIMA